MADVRVVTAVPHGRRWLRFAAYGIASLVIVLGILAGAIQLAVPWLEHHPEQIEHWLSARLNRAVTIGHVDSQWIGGGPVLTLDDVRIAMPAPAAPNAIARAEIAFDLLGLVEHNRALIEFRVRGLDLDLVHAADGWQLHGLEMLTASDDAATKAAPASFSMGALGAIELTDLKFRVDDDEHDVHLQTTAPVLRILNRGDVTRVVARVRVADADSQPLDCVADLDIGRRSGDIYVGARHLDLGKLSAGQTPVGLRIDQAFGAVQMWARIDDGRVSDLRSRVALDGIRLVSAASDANSTADGGVNPSKANASNASIDKLAFAARWQRADKGWSLDVADLVVDRLPPARITIEERDDASGDDYRAGVAALDIAPFVAIVALSDELPDGLRAWLDHGRPRGKIEHADLDWRSSDDFIVNAALSALGTHEAGFAPGVDTIDIDLHGDAAALLLEIPTQALRVEYPRVFRKPFLFSMLAGDVVLTRNDDAWRIATDRVRFEGEGYGGELRGGVYLHAGRRPDVDLTAAVAHGDVVAAKLFWPLVSMSPKAIAWLDRALVGGHLDSGRVAIRGDLAAWPFHDLSGRFVARGEVSGATLAYNPEWPRAEKIAASATFINDSMEIAAHSLETLGNEVSEATATITDFGPLILQLDAKGEGSGADLLKFLRATPVGKRFDEQLRDIRIGGKGKVAFALTLPTKRVEDLKLDGGVDLVDANLDHDAYNLHFTDASGHLRFDKTGFDAGPLAVGFRGADAQLNVAAGGLVADRSHVFEASLVGRFPATSAFADVPVLLPALVKFPGQATWRAAVDIDASERGDGRKHLSVASELRGIAIDLPAPLAKATDAALPFRFDLDLPFSGKTFTATLGDIVAVAGRVPDATKPFAARVDFGATAASPLPAQGVRIGGRIGDLDAGGWIGLAGLGTGGAGGLVRGIDVRADDVLLGGRHFADVGLRIDPVGAATRIRIDSAELAGTLDLPSDNLRRDGITAKLERMHWPDAPVDAADTSALADIAPASLPPLHLSVADFALGKSNFGSAEFESMPTAAGMRIERLEAKSKNIAMTASGDWTGSARDNRSHLAIALSSPSLGGMMDALGFPGLIDGGTTQARIDAAWPGPPSAFALPKLAGSLDIDVAEGRILDVDTPSAGRIFGLFSLTEIPRRLSLDFSDFTKSGFSFTSIKGQFRLDSGDAYTDALTIKGPAADIVVSGRTGLRDKDYDQKMLVTPHAGSTLPIVGAIAGGPVGAAAGLVVQGVLNKPLGKAIASMYTVTGPWDKPLVTRVSRLNPRREPKSSAAEPSPK